MGCWTQRWSDVHVTFSTGTCIRNIVKGNSMLQVLHSETNFLETNFLNKIYIAQFLIYNLSKKSSQGNRLSAEKKPSFLYQRLPMFLFWTLLQTLQKSQPIILCVHLTLFSLWIDYSDKNQVIIIRTKLLRDFLKFSCIPYSVIRFKVWGKNLLLRMLDNFCYR